MPHDNRSLQVKLPDESGNKLNEVGHMVIVLVVDRAETGQVRRVQAIAGRQAGHRRQPVAGIARAAVYEYDRRSAASPQIVRLAAVDLGIQSDDCLR